MFRLHHIASPSRGWGRIVNVHICACMALMLCSVTAAPTVIKTGPICGCKSGIWLYSDSFRLR